MVSCPECWTDVDDVVEDLEFICPFCGQEYDEGFYICENCETLFNHDEEYWICINCLNENKSEFGPGGGDYDEFEDEYYIYDNLDVNQGWVGEHYG